MINLANSVFPTYVGMISAFISYMLVEFRIFNVRRDDLVIAMVFYN